MFTSIVTPMTAAVTFMYTCIVPARNTRITTGI